MSRSDFVEQVRQVELAQATVSVLEPLTVDYKGRPRKRRLAGTLGNSHNRYNRPLGCTAFSHRSGRDSAGHGNVTFLKRRAARNRRAILPQSLDEIHHVDETMRDELQSDEPLIRRFRHIVLAWRRSSRTGDWTPATSEWTGPRCEKCAAPIKSDVVTICRSCGWYASLGTFVELDPNWETYTDEAAEPAAAEPQKSHLRVWLDLMPRWGWVIIASVLAVVVESVVARFATPAGSSLRTTWSLSQLGDRRDRRRRLPRFQLRGAGGGRCGLRRDGFVPEAAQAVAAGRAPLADALVGRQRGRLRL